MVLQRPKRVLGYVVLELYGAIEDFALLPLV